MWVLRVSTVSIGVHIIEWLHAVLLLKTVERHEGEPGFNMLWQYLHWARLPYDSATCMYGKPQAYGLVVAQNRAANAQLDQQVREQLQITSGKVAITELKVLHMGAAGVMSLKWPGRQLHPWT